MSVSSASYAQTATPQSGGAVGSTGPEQRSGQTGVGVTNPWQSTTTPKDGGGTTVVPRSDAPATGSGPGELRLVAHLTEDGEPIGQGLVWNIFDGGRGPSSAKAVAPARLVRTLRAANPVVRLAPGVYLVNVSFGRANLTRQIEVAANKPVDARFVLNAGGLRVTALLAGRKPAAPTDVTFDVLTGEPDQLGARQRVVSGARPGHILRLNAGIYRLESHYGDANVVVRSDISVEAGKLTEATIVHLGAAIAFRLVAKSGGEAQSAVQWSIDDAAGVLVKESTGAVPRHVLARGSYVVTARHGGRAFRRGFTVTPGVDAQVEVVME